MILGWIKCLYFFYTRYNILIIWANLVVHGSCLYLGVCYPRWNHVVLLADLYSLLRQITCIFSIYSVFWLMMEKRERDSFSKMPSFNQCVFSGAQSNRTEEYRGKCVSAKEKLKCICIFVLSKALMMIVNICNDSYMIILQYLWEKWHENDDTFVQVLLIWKW